MHLRLTVDADGQVIVRMYNTINGCYWLLTIVRELGAALWARIESEERAKILLEGLTGLIGWHPAVSAMIIQCLVNIAEGEDVLCSKRNSNIYKEHSRNE